MARAFALCAERFDGLAVALAKAVKPATKFIVVLAVIACAALMLRAADESRGLRDPAWAPDGKHLAASWFDRIWTFEPNGRSARRITSGDALRAERDPAWSPDGVQIAFAAANDAGYDLYVAPSKGGAAERITSLEGDER